MWSFFCANIRAKCAELSVALDDLWSGWWAERRDHSFGGGFRGTNDTGLPSNQNLGWYVAKMRLQIHICSIILCNSFTLYAFKLWKPSKATLGFSKRCPAMPVCRFHFWTDKHGIISAIPPAAHGVHLHTPSDAKCLQLKVRANVSTLSSTVGRHIALNIFDSTLIMNIFGLLSSATLLREISGRPEEDTSRSMRQRPSPCPTVLPVHLSNIWCSFDLFCRI